MRTTTWFIAAFAGLAIAATACSSTSSSSSAATTSPTAVTSASASAPPLPSATAVEVKVATKAGFGKYLTDQQGRTLYVYLLDEPGTPACTGSCLAQWTPVLVKGKAKAGPGVQASALGTAKLEGAQQLTIGGQPAYTYVGDTASGDTNGQAIGGLWFTVDPSGARITGAPTASPSM